jgi:ABC-2 type transport system ATP-binding protein
MRQRRGTQALLGSPDLLILDEPANGLDPAGIREIRRLVRSLAEERGIGIS